jgi:hypothetical protein
MRQIFVVKLGWVLVGDIGDIVAEAKTTKISNASVVRRWGTDKGLGELAIKGPQKETILDPCGDAEISNHAILFRLTCSEANWK